MTTNEYQWIPMQWLHSGYILTTSDYILAHSGALKYMPKYGQIRFLGPRIWVLKRSCEMQFRSVYLRSIVMTKSHFCPISPLQLLGGEGGETAFTTPCNAFAKSWPFWLPSPDARDDFSKEESHKDGNKEGKLCDSSSPLYCTYQNVQVSWSIHLEKK